MQTTVEVGTEFRVRRTGRRCEGANHDLAPRRDGGESLSAQVTQTALDTMADHGVAHGSTDHEPDPGRHLGLVHHEMHDQGVAPGASTRAGNAPQVTTVGESMRRRKHGSGSRASRVEDQTARLLRPLRRREDRMERPARVRMRSRKPCTLWRRRLFGWYVRLLTSITPMLIRGITPAVGQTTPDDVGQHWYETLGFAPAPPAHAHPRSR